MFSVPIIFHKEVALTITIQIERIKMAIFWIR